MSDFFKDNNADLAAFSQLSAELGKRPDYVQGGGGNTSVKLHGGRMAIKASGFTLSDIWEKGGYAVLDYPPLKQFYEQGEPSRMDDVEQLGSAKTKECTLQIEGLPNLRPSVEAGFHSILNRFVAHSHSVYANFATCSQEGRELVQKALGDADYTWAFVPYTDPGARLTFSILAELRNVKEQTGKAPNAIFLQNHGFISTHDDAQQCLRIHEDANQRISKLFGSPAFPHIALEEAPGGYVSNTPYLQQHLASGDYPASFFTEHALYPDQLVFLLGTLISEGKPGEGLCIIDNSGLVNYNMSESRAMVVEQTLCAIVFIVENIRDAGYTLSTMGEAARSFIENWESEKYRKSVAK